MITKIQLERFKAITKGELHLTGLNLLTGVNGMGKSSCIQALLLLRQSWFAQTLPDKGLLLKGSLINMGRGEDVFHQFQSEETIFIQVITTNGPFEWQFKVDLDSELLPIFNSKSPASNAPIFNESLFQSSMFYLSAERVSPDTSYQTSLPSFGGQSQIGNRGEFAADYLGKVKNDPIGSNGLRHFSLPPESNDFLSNAGAWLSEISPNLIIDADRFLGIDRASLRYNYASGAKKFAHDLRPTNVGFGITYVLPIILAVLSAKPGDLVIIENPESHLHPRGQVKIGRFLSLAAQTGIQIIIETHSDHVVNGTRLAAKSGEIDSSLVSIFFFERNPEDEMHSTNISKLTVNADGKLENWSKGFFDEWENALSELL